MLGLSLTCSIAAAANPPSYVEQIRPILAARCLRCHGDERQTSDLNLGSLASLLRGGESGAAIVAGKPDESLLFQMVRDGQMPPEGNPPLTDDERQRLADWISHSRELTTDVPAITDQQIVPLMLLRCTACHGGRRREADLDLRTRAGILKGGKSGPAIVAGKPEESLLIRRIRSEEMPPRRQLVSVSVKPMEAQELKKLEAWVSAGMLASTVAPDGAQRGTPDKLVTDEDRDFWSFRRPRSAEIPAAPVGKELSSPVDSFIQQKLRDQGLDLTAETDRVTLIRRATFDLAGLPPDPDDVAQFVADPDPTAYEKLIDRLLASPHYGERWGRHWLDLAGYADSEGAQNEDRVRPNMWRYRDYVIRAWNADKPYSRFLQEQLAGDELADYEHASEITDEIYDNLVATGFLRTAPDRTFANITNFVPDRLEVIADEVQILGSAVLGLTLHCARCHTHKFDPIPQRDYYRLAAALKDALDEHDWLGPEVRQLKQVTSRERQDWESAERALTDEVAQLRSQADSATDAPAKMKIADEIKRVESRRKPEPQIRALWSRGDPSPTFLLQRGNYLTAGLEVSPGVLSVLTDGQTPFVSTPPFPNARATGRRLALARWLTQPDNPLTSRVIVNRLWKQHFGSGIVATPANFGRTGAPPTHPELLDWLAVELPRRDWSLKSLHRLLVHSATYRQSSTASEAALTGDPDNRWLSRMPLRRLEAEVIRDALVWVAGTLNDGMYGVPVDVDVRADGLVTARRTGGDRRSVYVLHRRTRLPTILESFDSPQMGPNCIERSASIVAPQALHLLNNSTVHELAGAFAERVCREAGIDRDRQVEHIHRLAFGCPPGEADLHVARSALEELTSAWQSPAGGALPREQAEQKALANYCHAVMNAAAFVFVD